jgi:hypothetical protein
MRTFSVQPPRDIPHVIDAVTHLNGAVDEFMASENPPPPRP